MEKIHFFGYGFPQFSNLTIADIDKLSPVFYEVSFDNETWESLKQIKIKARDNIRMDYWAITKQENGPKEDEWIKLEQITAKLDTLAEITENGEYFIYIKDTAGNTQNQSIKIEKVDNTPPTISYNIDTSTVSSGYVTINVTAEDSESGLYDSPFSWDKITWSSENSKKTITQNGRYKVYAEDNLGNISELEIKVDCFPQEGTYTLGEGNIVQNMVVSADWNENTNNNIQITLNNMLNIVAWQITTYDAEPSNFVELYSANETTVNSNESNTTNTFSDLPNNVVINGSMYQNRNTVNEVQHNNSVSLNSDPITITTSLDINITYYLWVKDIYGNINSQTFKISKADI